MDNPKEHIAHLWRQYIAGKATPEELEAFFSEQDAIPANDTATLVEEILSEYPLKKGLDREVQERILQEILHRDTPQQLPTRRHILFLRTWTGRVAAAILLLLGTGALYLALYQEQPAPQHTIAKASGIPPGKDGAILTLADGSQVVLDSLGNGIVATQNGAQARIENGALVYNVVGKTSGEVVYNTMSTPKGRQYSLLLPDGTRVWLNAASSIRYPTVFTGKERQVNITGEVYLEVAQHKAMPFTVHTPNGAKIDVLGTHFNVNAYADESSMRTTLLEGAIRVTKGSQTAMVQPGQQAQLVQTTGQLTVTDHADVDKIMAWKNGAFNFEGLSLQEAMRQLERWYDIEVVYQDGEVPNVHLWGKMNREVPLDALLKMLTDAQLKCKIEDKRKLVLMK